MMRASYHNHTQMSDGADTPAEFVRQARLQQVDILGFADHYFKASPTATTAPRWALALDQYETYFETLQTLREETKDIEIRIGLEFDWLDDSAAWLAPVAADPRLDYTVGSVHYLGTESMDTDPAFWSQRTQEERDAEIVRYWKTVRAMAESGLFDIVGHVDLVKKFAVYPRMDVTDLIREALDAIKAADMVLELNTSGWQKPCQEGYPSEAILRAAFQREIPVTLSADAHKAENLCVHFDRGLQLLHRVGYRSLARFRQRERFFEPISY